MPALQAFRTRITKDYGNSVYHVSCFAPGAGVTIRGRVVCRSRELAHEEAARQMLKKLEWGGNWYGGSYAGDIIWVCNEVSRTPFVQSLDIARPGIIGMWIGGS